MLSCALHRYELAVLPARHKETNFHFCCCLAASRVTLLSSQALTRALGLILSGAQCSYFGRDTVLVRASHPNGLSCAALQPRHIFLSPANDLGRLFPPPQGEQKHEGFSKDRDSAFPIEASCCSHQNSILSMLAVSSPEGSAKPVLALIFCRWNTSSALRQQSTLALHRCPLRIQNASWKSWVQCLLPKGKWELR